ncbi:rod shape-determining protein RodA [Desulforudis sp. 1031]|uniref:rod shape-determining protein RodA n=1 Tax=unclassified Candidatus Desulforudis TaxID=2635950 RepID=UPI003CE590C5
MGVGDVVKGRRIFKSLDYTLLLAVALLIVLGIVVISSATHITSSGGSALHIVRTQIIWVAVGSAGLITFLFWRYEELPRYRRGLYIIMLLMLAGVIFTGREALGAQRWIQMGPFSFQPSEFAKVIIIVTLADFLAQREGQLNTLKDLIPVFAFVSVPMLFILIQPDLGTTLVFLAITWGMLFMAGAKPKLLLSLTALGIVAVILIFVVHAEIHNKDKMLTEQVKMAEESLEALNVEVVNAQNRAPYVKVKGEYDAAKADFDRLVALQQRIQDKHKLFHKLTLKEYQMTRLTVFLNPWSDWQGAGYNVIQSQIAIGSGGIWGKGLYNGTQSQYNFLPIQHTDFIFSVLAEELGFVGGFFVLCLYLVFLYRGVRIAEKARDAYGTLVAAGIVSMFTFHILVNIGMNAGIMPVTGIPLPFLSYGGSAMIVNMACVGLLLNIWVRRQKIVF